MTLVKIHKVNSKPKKHLIFFFFLILSNILNSWNSPNLSLKILTNIILQKSVYKVRCAKGVRNYSAFFIYLILIKKLQKKCKNWIARKNLKSPPFPPARPSSFYMFHPQPPWTYVRFWVTPSAKKVFLKTS